MLWEKIIQTYNELPEDQRTSLRVASELKARGYNVHVSRVADVLKHTVLADRLSSANLEAAADVIHTLIDLKVYHEHSGSFNPYVSQFVNSFTEGLSLHDDWNHNSVHKLKHALSLVIEWYRHEEDLDGMLNMLDMKDSLRVNSSNPLKCPGNVDDDFSS